MVEGAGARTVQGEAVRGCVFAEGGAMHAVNA